MSHVEFHGYDIDHVVAGSGGAFAVETKWTNEPWQIRDGRFDVEYAAKAVQQCKEGAWKISSLLRGNYGIQGQVSPILVIWGPGRPKVDQAVMIDGVTVLPGQLLHRTLRDLPPVLDVDAAGSLVDAVRDFTRRRDDYDAKHQGIRRPAY